MEIRALITPFSLPDSDMTAIGSVEENPTMVGPITIDKLSTSILFTPEFYDTKIIYPGHMFLTGGSSPRKRSWQHIWHIFKVKGWFLGSVGHNRLRTLGGPEMLKEVHLRRSASDVNLRTK